MRNIFASVLIGSAVFATVAMAANDYVVMPKSTREFKLGAGGYASQQSLVNHKNSQASVTIRDKDGQAEVHADWEDHMFILAGEGKLVLGGTVEKPTAAGPGPREQPVPVWDPSRADGASETRHRAGVPRRRAACP